MYYCFSDKGSLEITLVSVRLSDKTWQMDPSNQKELGAIHKLWIPPKRKVNFLPRCYWRCSNQGLIWKMVIWLTPTPSTAHMVYECPPPPFYSKSQHWIKAYNLINLGSPIDKINRARSSWILRSGRVQARIICNQPVPRTIFAYY